MVCGTPPTACRPPPDGLQAATRRPADHHPTACRPRAVVVRPGARR